MKKIMILFAAVMLASTYSFAQLSIEAETGVGVVVNEDTKELRDVGFNVSKMSVPTYLGVGYKLPIEIPSLGSGIIVGGKIGYLTGTKATGEGFTDGAFAGLDGKLNYGWNTIPINAFVRAESKLLFTEIGLGLHAWTINFKADTENAMLNTMWAASSDNGLDFVAYVKAGLVFNLSEKMKLNMGVNLHSLTFDLSEDESDDMKILTAGLFLGLTFGL